MIVFSRDADLPVYIMHGGAPARGEPLRYLCFSNPCARGGRSAAVYMERLGSPDASKLAAHQPTVPQQKSLKRRAAGTL
jgi:hypothetical protein